MITELIQLVVAIYSSFWTFENHILWWIRMWLCLFFNLKSLQPLASAACWPAAPACSRACRWPSSVCVPCVWCPFTSSPLDTVRFSRWVNDASPLKPDPVASSTTPEAMPSFMADIEPTSLRSPDPQNRGLITAQLLQHFTPAAHGSRDLGDWIS